MPRQTTTKLLEFLQDTAEDHLRSVTHYTESDYSIEFIRDDVESLYSEKELDRSIEELRREQAVEPRVENVYVHGDLNCTIHCFEEAIEIHFPHNEHSGTAVAMDPHAVEELYGFIGDCLTIVESD